MMKCWTRRFERITLVTLLFTFFAAVPRATAQPTNRLGWSEDQARAWQAMYDSDHPYWQDLLAKADNPDVYGEDGIYDGLCYLITGDNAYALRAWAHNTHWRGRTYNSDGDLPANSNITRHRFSQLSLLYSWIADALDPADKAHFRDILDLWTDLVTGVGDFTFGMTCMNDSDEVIGHYFGVVLYALAIADEDPQRSQEILGFCGPAAGCDSPLQTMCIGGVDATGIDRTTWRNTIAEYATNDFPGGLWMESTAYNNATLRYLLQGVDAVNNFYGEDKFPEVTAVYDDLARVLIQRSTPDFSEPFQWGDMDAQHLHNFSLFHGLGLYGYVYHATRDPLIADRYLDFYERYRPNTGNSSMFFNLDPDARRQTPQGPTSHDAFGRGVAYWHNGWRPDDSFFASTMFNPTRVQHDRASMVNFNLWRRGGWAVVNPKGYLPHYAELPYLNTLMIYGGMGRCQEAWGRYGFQADANYLYHIGGTGGQFVEEGYWHPPSEAIHEWTRTHMLLHHDDGSDSLILFDRLNLCGPIVGPDACITPDDFADYRQTVRDWVEAFDGKHQWIIHMPTDQLTVSGNVFSWPAPNGETVRLTSFMDNFSYAMYDELAAYHQGGPPLYLRGWVEDSELHYQLHLVPDKVKSWTTMLNVLHVGGDATVTQLASDNNMLDTARGVLIEAGDTRTGLVMNATRAATPPPTPRNGAYSAHDPHRKEKNEQMHFFKRGFMLTIPAGSNTMLRIADLDPAKAWTYQLGNSDPRPMTVSGEGLSELPLGVLDQPLLLTVVNTGYCAVDLTGDGITDLQDILLFLIAWLNHDPMADWNNDDVFDASDLFGYINDWNLGCV